MILFQLSLVRNDGVKVEDRPEFRLEDYTALCIRTRLGVSEERRGSETTLRYVFRVDSKDVPTRFGKMFVRLLECL
jgi:hypothetical protein